MVDRFFESSRWWLTWLMVAVLSVLGRLPCAVRLVLGGALGWVLQRTMIYRRRIAAANLAHCFAHHSPSRREELLRRHFVELGIAVFETAAAWSLSSRVLDEMTHCRGVEHVEAALANGRGAIVVAAHLTSLEMSMQLASRVVSGYAIYRRNKNPVLDRVILAGRSRQGAKLFEREDMRTLLAALRANEVVWFSPDQDHGLAKGAFIEFFGQPAATVTTTARIAAKTGAAVVPLLYRRLPRCGGYEFQFLPALTDFPGDDLAAATRTLNRIIEQQVYLAPEQYLWVHRRFKTRPPDALSIYGPSARARWFCRRGRSRDEEAYGG